MRYSVLVFAIICSFHSTWSQGLYFPPISGDEWETIEAGTLGYCQDSIVALYDFLDSTNSKAFLLLKNGKIVLEKYFGQFQQDSIWYWASAGKTITALLTGIAQQDGALDIEDTTSHYLGEGWTSMNAEREKSIRIRHQLSMTTGMDDSGAPHCTDPECLTYIADPGARWSYHNAPYTLITEVIENAINTNYNIYTFQKLKQATGMDGIWLNLGYNRVFFSTARSMARFGLLILNKGQWEDVPLLQDTVYFNEMVTPSQNLNESYGYLWWLNGFESFMLPGTQFVFDGALIPSAPNDAIFGLGANAQILSIVPSENLIAIRMGNDPGSGAVSLTYVRSLWEKINKLDCVPSVDKYAHEQWISIYPNPASHSIYWDMQHRIERVEIYNSRGQFVMSGNIESGKSQISIDQLRPAVYHMIAYSSTKGVFQSSFVKHR